MAFSGSEPGKLGSLYCSNALGGNISPYSVHKYVTAVMLFIYVGHPISSATVL